MDARNVVELERMGCKTFVCPNISLIEETCKNEGIRDDIIERAREIAIEYFKKTYHNPRYTSAIYVLPATVYISCRLKGDKRSQTDIGRMFGVSHTVIKKWYRDIMKELNIKTFKADRKLGVPVYEYSKFDVESELIEIEKIGKLFPIKNRTIIRAKKIALEYFEKERFIRYIRSLDNLRPALIYVASIIEDDKITQLVISQKLNIPESNIASWHQRIVKTLGIKIIAHNSHTICILEDQVVNY